MLSPAECDRLSYVNHQFKHLARSSESWKCSFLFELKSSTSPPRLLVPEEYRNLRLKRLYIRFDGLYFAKCSYVRVIGAGQSLTDSRTFVPVSYYRFLRFFRDGTVAMMTQPADISSGIPRAPRPSYEKLINTPDSSTLLDPADVHCHDLFLARFTIQGELVTLRYNDGANQWIARLSIHHSGHRLSSTIKWISYSYWNTNDVDAIFSADHKLLDETDIPKECLYSLNLSSEDNFPPLRFKSDQRLDYLF
jgi:hypothetical protein